MRLSASDLDAWRYWRDAPERDDDGESDADKLARLLRQLRKEEPPSLPMLVGKALHKALELSVDGDYDALAADGFRFVFDCDAVLDLPPIRELKREQMILIDGEPVTLVGVVDALSARRIDDHKWTGSSFDAEKYLNSYQWRFYLDLFNADRFRWNVFEGSPDRNEPDLYRIKAVHTLEAYRYPGMLDDLDREIRRFIDFARAHLPERFERVAA